MSTRFVNIYTSHQKKKHANTFSQHNSRVATLWKGSLNVNYVIPFKPKGFDPNTLFTSPKIQLEISWGQGNLCKVISSTILIFSKFFFPLIFLHNFIFLPEKNYFGENFNISKSVI